MMKRMILTFFALVVFASMGISQESIPVQFEKGTTSELEKEKPQTAPSIIYPDGIMTDGDKAEFHAHYEKLLEKGMHPMRAREESAFLVRMGKNEGLKEAFLKESARKKRD